MFLFLTSCGSSVEHQKRMRIICQRKKRRRGRNQQRRWTYLDLIFYSSWLSTSTINTNCLSISCRTRTVFFLSLLGYILTLDLKLNRQRGPGPTYWFLYHACLTANQNTGTPLYYTRPSHRALTARVSHWLCVQNCIF